MQSMDKVLILLGLGVFGTSTLAAPPTTPTQSVSAHVEMVSVYDGGVFLTLDRSVGEKSCNSRNIDLPLASESARALLAIGLAAQLSGRTISIANTTCANGLITLGEKGWVQIDPPAQR